MSNVIQRAVARSKWPAISMEDYVQFFNFGGNQYPFGFTQTMSGNIEQTSDFSFEGFILSAYKANGVVFACMLARQLTFSEARFSFRSRTNGRPGDYFGTQALSILETPWRNGTTADLLSRAIQDADLSGNFFATRRDKGTLRRMRPDWVTIIIGSYDDPKVEAGDLDAEVVGYMYHPGGRLSNRLPVLLLPEMVAHWAPIPDPAASYRGMSWLLPVIREFMSDSAMIVHKQKFFENGATPNMVVTLEPTIKKEAFREWVEMFSQRYTGALNAYKTLYLGAGATVTPVGKDFRQMDFALTQAAGETRIAAAAGVPPVIVGLSEGLKAATYSNYVQARRRFGDMTMRPLWRSMASAMSPLVQIPAGAELWYDDRDIPFLDEDFKDRAEVQAKQATSMSAAIQSGWDPDAVIDAVVANDWRLLKGHHTGLFSVQLQPPLTSNSNQIGPGDGGPATPPTPAPEPKKPDAGAAPSESKSLSDLVDLLARASELTRRPELPAQPGNVEVHAHFAEGMVQVDSPVTVEGTTIAEGAFRADAPHVTVDSPVTIEAGAIQAPVTFEEGAIRGGDVTIEPTEFELRDGAIQVTTPVTIAEGAVRIEEGALRVDSPITVEGQTFELRDGAIHVTTPVTIAEGAVQVDSPITVERSEFHVDAGAIQVPVTVERTEVHVDEGAVQVTTPVTVERTEVHVDEGAVRVDAPITVERTEVHVDEGAVRVDVSTPDVRFEEGSIKVDSPVTIERTEVHLDPGSVSVPVTVQPAEVRIEEGAVHVQVDSPVTIQPAEITVETPEVRVEVQPAEVRFEEGAIQVDAQTTIERGAVEVSSPVEIAEGAVRVDAPVTIDRGAVDVTVEAAEAPSVDLGPVTRAVEELDARVSEMAEPKRKRIVRDDEGRVVEVVEVVGSEVDLDPVTRAVEDLKAMAKFAGPKRRRVVRDDEGRIVELVEVEEEPE